MINEYLRCPSKVLKARIVCITTCKDKHCLYHPNYRERPGRSRSPKRDIPDPIDSAKPIKPGGIKAGKKLKINKNERRKNEPKI